ncbi:hypothetical protein [Streptomyces sp. NPDC058295]|uniref:hypothetical protein n=1 Tax=Streptomyces sp. NPDC058295 TaxID=3346431 RepID=UPI0036E12865
MAPEIFPNVKEIFVNCRSSLPDITDITPLKRIKELTISLSYADNVVGQEEFSPEAVNIYPRPRTEIT